MDGFGLCKAHAVNLANLIWALTMEKTHNPKKFWLAALQNNCSMYRPWVHIEQAKRAGWTIEGKRRPWLVDGNTLYNQDWQVPMFDSHMDQLKKIGFWTHQEFMPGCSYTEFGDIASFTGLIATHRIYKCDVNEYLTFATIGCDNTQLIDIVIAGKIPCGKYSLIEGSGTVTFKNGVKSIAVNKFKLF
jgi:hypothetical protein